MYFNYSDKEKEYPKAKDKRLAEIGQQKCMNNLEPKHGFVLTYPEYW